jgi:glycosyltransferase involved in cell wall biosynthesis
MRILFVANFFPPTHTAGTETYTHGLARTLREWGHDVRVVCAGTFDVGDSHIPDATTDEVDGIHVTRLHFNWQRARDIFMDLAGNEDVGNWFAAYLHAWRPDVVHVTSCDTLSPSVITVAKAHELPVIVTLTDFWFLCMRHTLLKGDGTLCCGPESAWGCLQCLAHDAKAYTVPRAVLPEAVVRAGLTWASTKPLLTRQRGLRGVLGDVARRQETVRSALLQADIILAPTAFLRMMFVRNGYPPDRISVSAYGMDDGWVPEDREKTPAAGVRIGYLGQIEPLKGVDLLVRAFRRVATPDATLTLYGNDAKNPAYTAELRRLSEEDPRIHFAGPFSRDERAAVLRNLDVVVVPSRWYENAPIVIAEAHAMRTPVIAANLGGMAEVVRDDTDGMLFAPDDIDDLTRCLQRVIDEPGLLASMRTQIQAPRTIADDARALIARYEGIVALPVVTRRRVTPGETDQKTLSLCIANAITAQRFEGTDVREGV